MKNKIIKNFSDLIDLKNEQIEESKKDRAELVLQLEREREILKMERTCRRSEAEKSLKEYEEIRIELSGMVNKLIDERILTLDSAIDLVELALMSPRLSKIMQIDLSEHRKHLQELRQNTPQMLDPNYKKHHTEQSLFSTMQKSIERDWPPNLYVSNSSCEEVKK
jgi:uncharacterized protein with PhoU and TrkA domain